MASHPGAAPNSVTAIALRGRWAERVQPEDVLGFYRETDQHGFMSNFFRSNPPFQFRLPPMLPTIVPLTPANGFASPVSCAFAEKAIMLCKAAVMGDRHSYQQIAASTQPVDAKRLGRNIQRFDQDRWDKVVCRVACDVLWAKFSEDAALRSELLATGDRVLAEVTKWDQIWGIGMDPCREMLTPSKWKGANVLGWALMEVRNKLQQTRGASAVPRTGPSPRLPRLPGPLPGVATWRRDLPRGNPVGGWVGAGRGRGRDEFVDDDALLAVDLDAAIASASPARPAHPQPAAAAASVAPAAVESVDDDALLAMGLDGIVAAASPSPSWSPSRARQHTGLTSEQTDKIAQNKAKAL